MDFETIKKENESYKQEIKELIEKVKKLEEENKRYRRNYSGGLPQGFSGYNQ